MNEQLEHRLIRVAAAWPTLLQATTPTSERWAKEAVLRRYQAAVYRYLVGVIHDAEAADKLFHEFAERFVVGRFRCVTSGPWRFRDFVQTLLCDLIRDYHESYGGPDAPSEDADGEFLDAWRKALLDRAWEGLATRQRPAGRPYHDALRHRAERPELSYAEIAQQLTERLRPRHPYTDAGIRKVVQASRILFADLLVSEVGRSLPSADPREIEREVIELGFLSYCREALKRLVNSSPEAI